MFKAKPAFTLSLSLLGFLFSCFFSLPFSFSQTTNEETLTITTYYPAPFGVYNEMRSKMMAVGTNYYDGSAYPWDTGGGCTGDEICNADLVVQGNVGIGTTTPTSKLHIYGGTLKVSDVADARLNLLHNGSANAIVGIHGLPPSGQTGFILSSAFGISKHLTGIDDGDSYLISRGSGKLHFGESSDAPTLTIVGAAGDGQGSGNVGIGTTSPGAKLEVAGQVKITGGTPAAGEVLTSDSAGLATWEPAGGVPSGAVMFFNLPACPTGWSALVAARGRYLVGLPSAGTLAGTAGTALTNLESREVGRHGHGVGDPGHLHRLRGRSDAKRGSSIGGPDTYAPSSVSTIPTDASVTNLAVLPEGAFPGTNAPYLQLLVCSKD